MSYADGVIGAIDAGSGISWDVGGLDAYYSPDYIGDAGNSGDFYSPDYTGGGGGSVSDPSLPPPPPDPNAIDRDGNPIEPGSGKESAADIARRTGGYGPGSSESGGGGALTGLGSALLKGITAGAKALGGGSGSGSGSDSGLANALANFPKSIPSSSGMMQAAPPGRGDGGARTVGADAVVAWNRVFSTRRARSDD